MVDNYFGLLSCAISLPSHCRERALICPTVVLYWWTLSPFCENWSLLNWARLAPTVVLINTLALTPAVLRRALVEAMTCSGNGNMSSTALLSAREDIRKLMTWWVTIQIAVDFCINTLVRIFPFLHMAVVIYKQCASFQWLFSSVLPLRYIGNLSRVYSVSCPKSAGTGSNFPLKTQ